MDNQDDVEKQSLSIDNDQQNEDDANGSAKRFKNIIKKFLSKLKFLTPHLIIVFYSIAGAYIFIALERDNDIRNRLSRKLEIETARNSALATLMEINVVMSNRSEDWDMESYILNTIRTYEENIGFSFSEDTVWNFWNAILYAGTIYTTIGYGNIACATVGGRLMSIFYAIIGIPLVLNTLNDVGKFLLKLIEKSTKIVNRCKIKNVRKKRRRTGESSGEEECEQELESAKVDPWGTVIVTQQEDSDLTSTVSDDSDPPVVGAVIVTISWLFICSGIFCIWEDWDYFTSFYFFFVSLSTIGFGDVVPAHPEYMVMVFPLVIIGLALVSVCINVVQQQLEDMYMSLLMTLLKDYQRMVESGENERGANIGMVRLWSKNKKAKWLLPLLGKDKRNIVMQKFQEEAKAHNIELPAVFTSVDKKSGLPTMVKAAESEKIEQWVSKIEEIQLQKAAARIEEEQEIEAPTFIEQHPDTRHMTSQTSLNVYTESEQQTYSSSVQIREATSQTALCELKNRHMQTASSLFQLREAMSQTAITETEATAMQTLSSVSLQQECSSQTIIKQFHEQPMQTTSSYFRSKESESQTLSTTSQSSEAQTFASSIDTQDNLSQTNLSLFAMQNCDSQTDIFTQRHSDSQTYPAAFLVQDYGSQTDATRNLIEAVSQTDISALLTSNNEFGSQTTLATSEQDVQTEVDHVICASQTDLSSFMLTDNDCQTYLSTSDSSLQHGSSLAELASTALQATCQQNDSTSQTLLSTFQLRETQSQTALVTAEEFTQTNFQESLRSECQSQTELNVRENDNQTSISFFKLRDTDSQTLVDNSDQGLQTVYEVDESECQTDVDTSETSSQIGSEFFRLKHMDSQTTLMTDEAVAQTSSSYFDVNHFGSQTLLVDVEESQVQTDSPSTYMHDQSEQTCLKPSQNDVAVQTGVLVRIEHLISKKLGKTKEDQLESPFVAKRKSLRKISADNNKTLSDDETRHARRTSKGELIEDTSSEDEGPDPDNKGKLLWTPFDGRHVEKQQPVSALKKKFERRTTTTLMEPTKSYVAQRRRSAGSIHEIPEKSTD